MAICPICGGEAKPRPENKTFPFCNARCQMVDLGKWMNEEYRVPLDDSSDEDPEEGGTHEKIVRH